MINYSQVLDLLNNDKVTDYKKLAIELDKNDSLKAFRNKFHIPQLPSGREKIYLCGNSLGLQPKSTKNDIERHLNKWANFGVEGHFKSPEPWATIDDIVLDTISELIGAEKDEIVIMNSLTVNLHLMLSIFYKPTSNRNYILIEDDAFPSDMFLVQSHLKYHNYQGKIIRIKKRENDLMVDMEHILSVIAERGHEISIILLPGVQYKSGQVFDIKKITKLSRKMGCIVGFDLAHAIGNIPLKLHEWDVDFACWCSYKYLNSGPGGIGGLYINKRYCLDKNFDHFNGWWGESLKKRFQFDNKNFDPELSAYRFRMSNPNVLSVVTLNSSLKLFNEAGMNNLRRKSILLTLYLEKMIKSTFDKKLKIETPTCINSRGAQLTLFLGSDINIEDTKFLLQEEGIVCDIRDCYIRVAPVPLYNSFIDIYNFVIILSNII